MNFNNDELELMYHSLICRFQDLEDWVDRALKDNEAAGNYQEECIPQSDIDEVYDEMNAITVLMKRLEKVVKF